jgi:hypothetical protein
LGRCHLERKVAPGLRGARAGVGEDLGKRANQVFHRLAPFATPDLGLQDVDAGLGEPAHVRHLGLELEAFGVHQSEIVDGPCVEIAQIPRVDDPGRAHVLHAHPAFLPGPTVPARLRVAVLGRRLSSPPT